MLITALILVWDNIVRTILSLIPEANLSDIPVVGATIQDTLVEVITTWNAIMVTIPYLEIVWQLFLYGVIPFELGLILLKVFLGNRSPQNIN